MLNISDLSSEFEDRRSAILDYERGTSGELEEYKKSIPDLDRADASLNSALPQYSGARIFEPGATIRRFRPAADWNGRQDAMEWVDSVLSGVAVGSADGSQIYPDKNYGIPIAVVQIGSVRNRHTEESGYAQRTSATLITPDEFADADVYAFSKTFVDVRRFALECDALIDLMHIGTGSGRDTDTDRDTDMDDDRIYLLLDGTLVPSHINALRANVKEIYIGAMRRLLDASNETGNPVIGYVDVSVQRDVVTMMRHIYGLPETKRLFDPALFAGMLNWGDRTKAFVCNRDDRRGADSPSVLDMYVEHRDSIAFFYMRMGDLPSRIEFPVWCADDAAKIDRIADIIRAETIIRGSYPDILMLAHRNAVITTGEHSLFYRMLNRFCTEHGIAAYTGAKQAHKELDKGMSRETGSTDAHLNR
ncbi:MAG: DNA double-strand break repair nuclease NurA [Euryarchaeota archaeon]|nr:DNA double-strand break repair nuclease NurA [Euryarchaeota archaeon]